MTRAARLGLALAALAVALTATPGPARAQGVEVGFAPTRQIVGAGSGFDVELRVTAAGSSFNGFAARLRFDPTRVTLVPASPTSAQQGSLMTGACGTTFHQFSAGPDSCDITDVLLCNGISLTGPGQIYKLHFLAANAPNTSTILHIEQIAFYDTGVRVLPVDTQDDTVYIDNPVGVGEGGTGAAIGLRAAPNPARGGTTLLLSAPRAGAQSLLVQDVAGRIVRRLGEGWFAAGARAVPWDGRDDAGRAVPPGIYLARWATVDGARLVRVVLVH